MPTTTSTTAKRGKRAATVINIPKDKNRIYGSDVPMPWEEAAKETGIALRTFRALMDRREIDVQKVGRRSMIRPSAVKAYLERNAKRAV